MRQRRCHTTAPVLAALLAATLGCSGSTTSSPAAGPHDQLPTFVTSVVVADHTTLAASSIPPAALDAARALRMHLRHASVGGNIWGGLTTLAASDQSRYALPNWVDGNRGNPGWEAKITDLSTFVAAHADAYDVFQMKFCYIDQAASFASYRDAMLALEAAHPTKRFIWWTMPITTSGSENALRAAFNQQVRAYCAAHGKALYDVADIESHTLDNAVVESGGVEEMDPAWSSDGGHLNGAGSARAAQAMWWLMARVAGWSGP